MITLCIPTLSRYDLLVKCVQSAEEGTVKPDRYLIQDNGCKLDPSILNISSGRLEVMSNGYNIGVAASWNKFIRSTQEIRMICNDDIEFLPNTLEIMLDNYNPNTLNGSHTGGINVFSAFTFPDSLLKSIGYFDETISPNYAYFEDDDYNYRMKLVGIELYHSPFDVSHFASATVRGMGKEDMNKHHERFRLARNNYIKKWGGEPHKEVFKKPYGIV